MQSNRLFAVALSSLVTSCLLFTGCSMLPLPEVLRDIPSDSITGTIFGGQQPVVGATVTVWLAGTSGYGMGATQLASTMTDAAGNFKFASSAYTCAYSNAPVYITASGGNPGGGINSNLVLAAGLGTCSTAKNATVNINEVTTAVTAFALSHFFTTTLGGAYTTDMIGGTAAGSGTYNAGLALANTYTIPNLINLSTGTVKASTAAMTIEAAKIYSIANVLAACVNSTGQTSTTDTATSCGQLFNYATPPGGTRPLDTLQAAVQMALYPYQNVTSLYNLTTAGAPFTGLSTAPNDWTVGVSYISSTLGLGINGTPTSRTSSNIDIDANGHVWFPTNASSVHGLAYFDPTSLSFNGPYATNLVHPQYLGITNQNSVYGSDLAGARIAGVSATNPTSATSYSTSGFTGPLVAANYANTSSDAIIFTGGGTASSLGSTLYQDLNGTITNVVTFSAPPTGLVTYSSISLFVDAATSGAATSCRYESDQAGTAYIQASTGTSCFTGGIANTTSYEDGVMTVPSTNQLCDFGIMAGNAGTCFTSPVALSTPEGIALDGDGNLWIANAGNSSVSTLGYAYSVGGPSDYQATSDRQYLHSAANGNTLVTPYGIAIDRSGNVWVSNAGCISTNGSACTPGSFILSELIGAAAPTVTPLATQNFNSTQGTRPSAVQARGALPLAPNAHHTTSRRGRPQI